MCDTRRFGRTRSRFTRCACGNRARYDTRDCPIRFPNPTGGDLKTPPTGSISQTSIAGEDFPRDRPPAWPGGPARTITHSARRVDAHMAHGLRPTATDGVSKRPGGRRSGTSFLRFGPRGLPIAGRRFFRPHSKGTASSSSDGQRCEEGCLDVDALLQLQSHSCALTITYSFGTVN